MAIDNFPHIVGGGLGAAPDYEGSDDYMFGGAGFARFLFGKTQRYLMLTAFELQANLVDHPWFRIGPSLNYRFGRSDVDDPVVDKMREIDDTVEGGAFVGVEFIDGDNPRRRIVAMVDFLHDLGSEHDGYTVTVGARVWEPLSRAFDLGLGATFCYADDDYMDTYFSVDAKDSQRSGLPVFRADGGAKDVRFTSALVFHLSENWHLAAGVQYQRLMGDAEDSPVVDDRGSADQWYGGLGLGYSW